MSHGTVIVVGRLVSRDCYCCRTSCLTGLLLLWDVLSHGTVIVVGCLGTHFTMMTSPNQFLGRVTVGHRGPVQQEVGVAGDGVGVVGIAVCQTDRQVVVGTGIHRCLNQGEEAFITVCLEQSPLQS